MHNTTFEKSIIKPGDKIDLSAMDTAETYGWTKAKAQEQTKKNHERISQLQELLYIEGKRAFLMMMLAMDAGGKDGTINALGSAMNPAGTRVASFKQPTAEELSHDFLWRIKKQLPKAGEIVMFNRSHYEDVGIVRVHNLVPEKTWRERYGIINDFEEDLSQPSTEIPEGTHVLKFFLNISKDEQWRRLRDRVMDPAKQWKLSESDLKERVYWDDYMKAYSEAISNCTTEKAPFFIIPADNKWMRDLMISQIVVNYMEGLHMQMPKPSVDIEAIRKEYFSDEEPVQKPVKKKAPPSPKGPFNLR